MTGGNEWERDGLGKTGETYLVGPDHLMRSNSRFLIESPDTYVERLRKTQTPEAEVATDPAAQVDDPESESAQLCRRTSPRR